MNKQQFEAATTTTVMTAYNGLKISREMLERGNLLYNTMTSRLQGDGGWDAGFAATCAEGLTVEGLMEHVTVKDGVAYPTLMDVTMSDLEVIVQATAEAAALNLNASQIEVLLSSMRSTKQVIDSMAA